MPCFNFDLHSFHIILLKLLLVLLCLESKGPNNCNVKIKFLDTREIIFNGKDKFQENV